MSGAIVKTSDKMQTVKQLLERAKPAMMRALPKHVSADRLVAITMTAVQQNPDLLDCDRMSFLGSVLTCAQLGLEPGPLGHAYLLPFRDKKSGKTLVQFIPGYRGMIDLARRSGQIESLTAQCVYANDEFDYGYGDKPYVTHRPSLSDRGEMIGAYAVARLKDTAYPQIEFMSKREIDKIRARSKAADSGPWVTDYDEMARKTTVRRLFKYLPVSVEISRAAALDDQAAVDQPQTFDYIDVEVGEDKPDTKDTLTAVIDKAEKTEAA